MTTLRDQSELPMDGDDWLQDVRTGLTQFQRSSLHDVGLTEEREWWLETFEHPNDLIAQLSTLIQKAEVTPTGCWELQTRTPGRVKVRGRRLYGYQLVYWGGHQLVPAEGDVVRHRCHNRLCLNPHHLEHGDQRDNAQDELDKLLRDP